MRHVDDWKTGLELIKAQIAEYEQYRAIMTQYEAAMAKRVYQEKIDQWKPQIVENLLKEQEIYITRYHAQETLVARAKAAEINRWDASKLANQLQVTRLLVEQAMAGPDQDDPWRGSTSSKQERLQKLYQDAKASNDIYKMRSVAEVLLSVPLQPGDNVLNHLQKQAGHDLKALQWTEDQQKAVETLNGDWNNLVENTIKLEEVAPLLGDGNSAFGSGPLHKAVRRITIDQTTGERLILEPDNPAVTGVMPLMEVETQMAEN